MPTTCAVSTCRARHKRDGDTHFFHFPKKESIQKIWMERSGRTHNPITGFICSKHFALSDYDPSAVMQRKLMGNVVKLRLKKNAVPTLFLPVNKSGTSCLAEEGAETMSYPGSSEINEDIMKRCRICLIKVTEDGRMDIFTETINDEVLSTVITNVANVKITEDDGLPRVICLDCLRKLRDTYFFQKLIVLSDAELRHEPTNESLLSLEGQEDMDPEDEHIEEDINKTIIDAREKIAIRSHALTVYITELEEKERVVGNAIEDGEGIKEEFQCQNCSKIFKNSTQLQRHIAKSQEKPFQCDICDKVINFQCAVDVHKRLHVEERPTNTCKTCGKSYEHLSTLTRHHEHRNENHTAYQCKICDKTFKLWRNLERHSERMHFEILIGSDLDCEDLDDEAII